MGTDAISAPPSFLSLPAELRNRIYELVLFNEHGAIDPMTLSPESKPEPHEPVVWMLNNSLCPWLSPPELGRDFIITPREMMLGLLATNQQVRREAYPIFVSINRWAFGDVICLCIFLASSNANFSMYVTSIETHTDLLGFKMDQWSTAVAKLIKVRSMPCIRELYITVMVLHCKTQRYIERYLLQPLRAIVGLGPTIIVETVACMHCIATMDSNYDIWADRQWWLWKCEAGKRTWQIYRRLGESDIDRTGAAVRGREKPEIWWTHNSYRLEGPDPTKCLQCQWEKPEMKALKRCSKCKIARYCSAKCQKIHWRDHATNCVDFA